MKRWQRKLDVNLLLELLREREWMYLPNSDKVHCPTCGAQYGIANLAKHHRKGCVYKATIRLQWVLAIA